MKKSILEANFIMFDLDNTLYNEKDYLFQGYFCISKYLGLKYSISTDDIFEFLIHEFQPFNRSNLFDQMLNKFSISGKELPHILNILRTYTPVQKIQLFPEVKKILNFLKSNNVLFVVVTNGNPIQQRNKIKNLDWDDLNPVIYFANDYEPKPSSKVYYEAILPDYNIFIQKKNVLFVGDSIVDKEFSKNIGVSFINVNEILIN